MKKMLEVLKERVGYLERYARMEDNGGYVVIYQNIYKPHLVYARTAMGFYRSNDPSTLCDVCCYPRLDIAMRYPTFGEAREYVKARPRFVNQYGMPFDGRVESVREHAQRLACYYRETIERMEESIWR